MKPGKCLGRLGFGLLLAFLALGLATPARAQNAGALFVPGPDLNIPRTHHCTATLPDGRAAVFGGQVASGFCSGAEIWSLGSNYFDLIPMANPRADFAFARMKDGRYLLAGGAPTMQTVEFFDPWGNFFEPFGELNFPRQGGTPRRWRQARCWWWVPRKTLMPRKVCGGHGPILGPNFEVTGPLRAPRKLSRGAPCQ